MAAHLRARQRPAFAQPLRVGPATRMLMLTAALAAALALMPRAQAQDNPAQGNGQNAPNAAAQKDNGNANANGAPARKTAAQRSQEDAQRLLGGPSMANGGYDMGDATPNSQRDALLNSERMRVAKPNTQTMGGPTAAGGDAAAAPAGAVRRPARGGAAPNNGAVAGVAAQRAAAANGANAGPGGAVYNSPYSERAGRDVFKSPW